MAGRKLNGADVPTPGPWLVRGSAEPGAPARDAMLGVEPAGDAGPGGWPFFLRQDREFAIGDTPLHLATGIQRLADARLMAAAPDLAGALLRLVTSPGLGAQGLDPTTQKAQATAWDLLARVTPHLRVWPDETFLTTFSQRGGGQG